MADTSNPVSLDTSVPNDARMYDYWSRKLGEARKGMPRAAARTREEVAAFFGDMTLVDPGMTDVWAWRPDGEPSVAASDVMTVLGGVARKD